MRLIVAGTRTITDEQLVSRAIDTALTSWGLRATEILSGCAHGPDTLALTWAVRHGVLVRRYPADWRRHGRRAGPLRNEQMAQHADGLIAVWDGVSRGTGDMIRRATDHGLRVYVHRIRPA